MGGVVPTTENRAIMAIRLRVEALEAMILGLGAQVDRLQERLSGETDRQRGRKRDRG